MIEPGRRVDLAHAAATDHVAEEEASDLLSGEAAGASELRGAIELGAHLAKERVALRRRARRGLELVHHLQRFAVHEETDRERRDVLRFDPEPAEQDLGLRRNGHGAEPARADDVVERESGDRRVSERERGVREHHEAGLRAETEEQDADRHDARDRGRHADAEHEAGDAATHEEHVRDHRRLEAEVVVAHREREEPRVRDRDGGDRDAGDALVDFGARDERE